MAIKNNNTGFDSPRLEGGLLSPTLLQKTRHYQLSGQTPQDYGIEKGLKLNDELGRYWRIAAARWEQFDNLRQREDQDLKALTVTDWLLPLLNRVLGYDIQPTRPVEIGERRFPITHTACNGAVTLVLTDSEQPLDKGDARFGEEGRKRSPSGLAQEYLNAEDATLWAIVSNGLTLRLLRDNPAMTRPAYLEFDLQRLFSEQNLPDFSLFWLLLHQSRLAPQDDNPEACYLEQWRNQGQTDGERILGELRVGVTQALRELGSGFVSHPDNSELRDAIKSGALSKEELFQELLRLIYRFLFLFTAEDRDLVLAPDTNEAIRTLYQQGYSLNHLRERARFRRYQTNHIDGWEQLLITFEGFAQGQPALGQPALGGLFANDQCPTLEQAKLSNRQLYKALFNLGWFESGRTLVRINYRDMDTEELGSVYESLLELIPDLKTEGRWYFGFMGDDPEVAEGGKGHARKLTGSYYTPDSLVQELIQFALVPVIQQRLDEHPEDPRSALLEIAVCDPACGSGHFLLAAARRLAGELARIEAGADQPTEQDYRHALREVVRHCIYGVDINPLSVELCKTALWLETIEPGKPLGFLDAHIQQGNALVGVFDPRSMKDGIPPDAFKPLTGDDKETVKQLKKRNRIDKHHRELLAHHETQLTVCGGDLVAMPEDNLQQIEQKKAAWAELMQGAACQDERQRADLFTAAFFATKTPENAEQVPTSVELAALEAGEPLSAEMAKSIRELAKRHRFFHWYLAFPEVLELEGFSVLLGNPPWDVSQLSEEEYFSVHMPSVAQLSGAKRKKAISDLEDTHPNVWKQYLSDKRAVEGQNSFFRAGGRNSLTAVGKMNLYALFAELFFNAIGAKGRAGVVVPTGIATDDSTKAFFAAITGGDRLVSLFDFENRDAIFPGVHRSYKFSLLTLGKPQTVAQLAFFASQTDQLKNHDRRFTLTSDEFALINPNTRTCPVFRSQKDAELTKKLYRAAPVLIREARGDTPEHNPWGVRFSQGLFNMTSASHLFKKYNDLNGELEGYMPLYEAKMVHHYDHRWATYETDGKTSRDCTLPEKQNPDYETRPRYWVDEWQVTLRTARVPTALIKAARKNDMDALKQALTEWTAGYALTEDDDTTAQRLLGLPVHDTGGLTPHAQNLQQQAESWPLEPEEGGELTQILLNEDDLQAITRQLLEARRPKYLLGWRDICRATDERTVIAGVIPLAAVGHTCPLMFPKGTVQQNAALLANLDSIIYDFVARQKVGGTHLTYGYLKQFPTLAPDQYTPADLDYIVPRVLELTYTSHALKPFAEDLGYHGEPYEFNPECRHQLKSELDAYYAKLYGLTRDELRYILDPAEVMGEDYPSETFRVLKNKELKAYGEYRTQRLVLAAWDRLNT